jgi:hypothetical protein
MKDFWKGFRTALGGLFATGVTSMLLLLIAPLRRWVFQQVQSLSDTDRTLLTILLAVLCIGLLVALILSWVSFFRFKMRLVKGELMPGELLEYHMIVANNKAREIVEATKGIYKP